MFTDFLKRSNVLWNKACATMTVSHLQADCVSVTFVFYIRMLNTNSTLISIFMLWFLFPSAKDF